MTDANKFQQDALALLDTQMDPNVRRVLEKLIMAVQANFDHLSGEAKQNVRVFNKFVEHTNGQFDELFVRLPLDAT